MGEKNLRGNASTNGLLSEQNPKKKIGARIGMRQIAMLLLSEQVVDATYGLGIDSEGRISSGIFSKFSMRIIEPRLLAST